MLKYFPPNSILKELIRVTWYKEQDLTGKIMLNSGGKYILTNEGDLLVRDVSDSDANAKFYCEISNKLTGKSIQSQAGQIILVGEYTNNSYL